MKPYRYPISPRLAAPTSVSDMMHDVLVALLPAFGMSLYLFGFRVLAIAFLSIGSCLLFQFGYGYLTQRTHSLKDLSPVVTGLLLAFCYPASLPLWAVPIGSFFAIVVVKELYGGLGCNFINPALAGRTFIVSAPLLMSKFPNPLVFSQEADVLTSATPLAYLQRGQLPPSTLNELFIGFHSGSLGEISTLMLLLGGCYLLLRRVITPVIPFSFLGTVGILCFFSAPEGIAPLSWTFAHLCSGGLVLGAFFMATDPVTSPTSVLGQFIYGFGCGLLTFLLRYFGSYPEGVCYGLLTMNCLVWLLDYIFAPRRFGTKLFEDSSEGLKELASHWGKIHFVAPKLPKLSSLHPKNILAVLRGQTAEEKEGKRAVTESSPSAASCIFYYGMVLLVTIGSISWAYSFTELQTHRTNELINLALLEQAMPEADFLSETPYTSPSFSKLYSSYSGQEHLGYCVEVSSTGFIDQITLLVGVNLGGAVTGIAVLNQNETLQIGAEVLKPSFLERFIGRSGTLSLWESNTIDGLSGATVTLEAVTDCVNRALEVVQLIDQIGALDLLQDVL